MYYLFIDLFVCLHCKLVCLHWKIRRFTAFLDSKIHTRLAIVTANEFGLAFPPRNLPKKFRRDPSTFYLVIVVTDRQTDSRTNKQTNRQTYAGENIILAKAFAGIIRVITAIHCLCSSFSAYSQHIIYSFISLSYMPATPTTATPPATARK